MYTPERKCDARTMDAQTFGVCSSEREKEETARPSLFDHSEAVKDTVAYAVRYSGMTELEIVQIAADAARRTTEAMREEAAQSLYGSGKQVRDVA